MCIYTGNCDSIFFKELYPFELIDLYMLLQQFVNTTPLKPHNRISYNFVGNKDRISGDFVRSNAPLNLIFFELNILLQQLVITTSLILHYRIS